MKNAQTIKQLSKAFERDVYEMQNPDLRTKVNKKRAEKAKKVAKKYGM